MAAERKYLVGALQFLAGCFSGAIPLLIYYYWFNYVFIELDPRIDGWALLPGMAICGMAFLAGVLGLMFGILIVANSMPSRRVAWLLICGLPFLAAAGTLLVFNSIILLRFT